MLGSSKNPVLQEDLAFFIQIQRLTVSVDRIGEGIPVARTFVNDVEITFVL